MNVLEIDGEFLDHCVESEINHRSVLVYRVRVTPRYAAPILITVWAQKRGRRVHYAAGFGAKPGGQFRGSYNLETVVRSANYRARRYATAYRKPRGLPIARLVAA